MTTTEPKLRDSARELDLIRADRWGYSARIERERGSTMLVITMDLTDFDRMVEVLGRDHGDAYERGFGAGFEAGEASGKESAAS